MLCHSCPPIPLITFAITQPADTPPRSSDTFEKLAFGTKNIPVHKFATALVAFGQLNITFSAIKSSVASAFVVALYLMFPFESTILNLNCENLTSVSGIFNTIF